MHRLLLRGSALLMACLPLLGGCQWLASTPATLRLPDQTAAEAPAAAPEPRSEETPDRTQLSAAFSSPAAKVRAEAVRKWVSTGQADLPDALTQLRSDRDPQVRAAVLRAVAAKGHPQAVAWLTAAMTDVDLQVRLEALAGLGSVGGPQAEALLIKQRETGSEAIRATAVGALAKMNVRKAMPEAVKDRSWRVRAMVAEALANWPDREGASLAMELLDDPSTQVQQRVLTSIRSWPLERAGPVLLAAMAKSSYAVRMMAAQQLAGRWPPAKEFPIDGGLQSRTEVLARLQERFRQEVGFAPGDAPEQALRQGQQLPTPSAQCLAQTERLLSRLSATRVTEERQSILDEIRGIGPELVPALEQLVFQRQMELPQVVYREVLAKQSPVFEAVEGVDSGDLTQQRTAAQSLAELAQRQPLPRLAVARLATLMVRQSDALLWRSALAAAAESPGTDAAGLAYAACSHPNPEVRRGGCQHLARHPDPRHAPVLLTALDDPHRSVVSAAVEALGAQGTLETPEPLRRLLATHSESLRAEVAVALTRLGDPAGEPALERLAYSGDPAVRRQVAMALGETGNRQVMPTLIRLLDDRTAVRRAALESLTQLAGKNVGLVEGQTAPDTDQQVARWKKWWQEQPAANGPP